MSSGGIWDKLELGKAVIGNVTNGRWSISGDLQYLGLDLSRDTQGAAFGRPQFDSTVTVFSLTGEYHAAGNDGNAAWNSAGASQLDAMNDVIRTAKGNHSGQLWCQT